MGPGVSIPNPCVVQGSVVLSLISQTDRRKYSVSIKLEQGDNLSNSKKNKKDFLKI